MAVNWGVGDKHGPLVFSMSGSARITVPQCTYVHWGHGDIVINNCGGVATEEGC